MVLPAYQQSASMSSSLLHRLRGHICCCCVVFSRQTSPDPINNMCKYNANSARTQESPLVFGEAWFFSSCSQLSFI